MTTLNILFIILQIFILFLAIVKTLLYFRACAQLAGIEANNGSYNMKATIVLIPTSFWTLFYILTKYHLEITTFLYNTIMNN